MTRRVARRALRCSDVSFFGVTTWTVTIWSPRSVPPTVGAPALHAELLTALSPFREPERDWPIDGLDRLVAERRLRHVDPDLMEDGAVFAGEERMGRDDDAHVGVTGEPAVRTGLALPGEAQRGVVVDSQDETVTVRVLATAATSAVGAGSVMLTPSPPQAEQGVLVMN